MKGDESETWSGLHDALSGKWSFDVLRRLDEGDAGFNELKRSLGGATAKTLSARLRELRCLGVVHREVTAASPPSTTYSLTPRGRRFVASLREMASMVESVPCEPCEDPNCSVPSVDEAATLAALEEVC